MTSDERRNVAEELRDLIDDDLSRDDPRSNVPLDDVERAIGLYGGFYDGGTTADCVEQLADLIDPTCEMEPQGEGFRCLACGTYHDMSSFDEFPWSHCPECGARVVRGDD